MSVTCWLLFAVLPWVEGAVVGLTAPWLVRRVHPATATWCLTLGAIGIGLATALGAAAGVVALLMPALGGPRLADLGIWDPSKLATALLVFLPLLAAALAMIPVGGPALRDLVAARLTWRQASPVDGVLVVEDDDPEAYAVPGRPGLVVVHTGLLDALSPIEQQVVLAHERSHLSRRHYVHVLSVRVAAWLNPTLRPLVRSVAEQIERWADEDAAGVVGDRTTAARAIARAALARSATRRSERYPVLAAASGGDATARARALMSPPLPARKSALFAVVLLALAFPAYSGVGARAVENAYEQACEQFVGAVTHTGTGQNP